MNSKTIQLEERLIAYSLSTIKIAESLSRTYTGNYIREQLTRSSLSPALNYGEAQFAESRNDFIHKMKVCLKELKESHISLKVILKKPLHNDPVKVQFVINECMELISIFVKSIETARANGVTSGKR